MCKWCVTASVQYLHYHPWNDLIIQIHSNHTRGVKQRRAKKTTELREHLEFQYVVISRRQAVQSVWLKTQLTYQTTSFKHFRCSQKASGPAALSSDGLSHRGLKRCFLIITKRTFPVLFADVVNELWFHASDTLKWSEQNRTETKSVSCNLPKLWRGDLGGSILRLESFCDQMQQRKKMKEGLKTASRRCRLQHNDTKKKQTPVHSCCQFSVLSSQTLRREDGDFLLHKETTQLKSTLFDSIRAQTLWRRISFCILNIGLRNNIHEQDPAASEDIFTHFLVWLKLQ